MENTNRTEALLANHTVAILIERPGRTAYWSKSDGCFGRVRQAHALAAQVRAANPGRLVVVDTTLCR